MIKYLQYGPKSISRVSFKKYPSVFKPSVGTPRGLFFLLLHSQSGADVSLARVWDERKSGCFCRAYLLRNFNISFSHGCNCHYRFLTNMLHLDPNEHVVLEVRKHWIVFFAQGFFLIVSAFLPLVGYEFLVHLVPLQLPTGVNISGIFPLLYILWILTLWIVFFVQWTSYYLDVWYITEKRIIDVEQKGFFDREVSSIRFDKVQDVSVEVRGIIATFLNFGNVEVQTASETGGSFSMRSAANPELIRKTVFTTHNEQSERTQRVQIIDTHGPDILNI
jgi:Bacterial PH domain